VLDSTEAGHRLMVNRPGASGRGDRVVPLHEPPPLASWRPTCSAPGGPGALHPRQTWSDGLGRVGCCVWDLDGGGLFANYREQCDVGGAPSFFPLGGARMLTMKLPVRGRCEIMGAEWVAAHSP
jgi:hypothetical protein